jgi:outer membrane protein insertion porin family
LYSVLERNNFCVLIFLLTSFTFTLPAQVIKSIQVTGNNAISNPIIFSLIKSRWQLNIDSAQIKIDQESIGNYYREEGFLGATVNYETLEDPSKKTFDLRFIITEGELYVIGEIEIDGLDKISKSYFLRLVNLKSGMPFSKKNFLNSQLTAMRSGNFQELIFKTTNIDTAEKRIDIILNIAEKKPYAFLVGTGIDTENGLKLSLNWKKRNFSGWGRNLELRGMSSVNHEKSIYWKRGSLGASYLEPIVFSTHLSGKLNTDYISDKPKNTNFGYRRFLIEAILMYEFSMIYDLHLNTRWQKDRLFKVPYAQDTKKFEQELFIDNNRFISLTLNRDNRDDLVDPSNGSLISLLIEKAGKPLGGENEYLKLFFEGSYYKSIYRRIVFAKKLLIGNLFTEENIENIPSYLRFYLGGSGSLRGYADRSLGPINIDGSRQGGGFVYLSNVELRYYLGYHLNFVAFLDLGNVWLHNQIARISTLKYSAGTGIRLRTKYGFFRLDFGIKLSDFSKHDIGRVHFGFGQSF